MAGERGGGVGKVVGASIGALGLLFARTADDCARVGARSAHVAAEGAQLTGKGLGAVEAGARLPRLGGAVEEVGAVRLGTRAAEEGGSLSPRGLRASGELGGFKGAEHLDDVGRGHSLEEALLEEAPGLASDVTSAVLDDDDEPEGALWGSEATRRPAPSRPFRLFGQAALIPLGAGTPAAPGSGQGWPRVLAPASSADELATRLAQSQTNAPLTVLARSALGPEGRWQLGVDVVDGKAFFQHCDRLSLLCMALVCAHDAPAACEGTARNVWRAAAAPLSLALLPAELEPQMRRFVGALLRARAASPELAGLTLLRLARDGDERGYVVRVSPKAPETPAPAASAPREVHRPAPPRRAPRSATPSPELGRGAEGVK